MGRLKVWLEGIPELVEGEIYGEGRSCSDGGFIQILVNGKITPSPTSGNLDFSHYSCPKIFEKKSHKSLLTLLPHRWFQYEESNPIELISEDAIHRCSSK